ncbi:uncharacterized protein RCO7_15127 [Rhynchosporium graminicola]|uniref:Uncharacterized protein n=1 Tax=Rhynchosporium graminicola TaxID=2792576 RepID=A0A1E1LLA9_9HELO|nr:uncharacterized protein RCO7_15127 [Rhynchosporium commune]
MEPTHILNAFIPNLFFPVKRDLLNLDRNVNKTTWKMHLVNSSSEVLPMCGLPYQKPHYVKMPLFASGLSISSYTGKTNISSVVEESQRLVQVNIETETSSISTPDSCWPTEAPRGKTSLGNDFCLRER